MPLLAGAVILVAFLFGSDTTTPLPALFFLACSAITGLVFADPIFYMACVRIGPRLALLLQSLSAAITALLGYFFLGEQIGVTGVAGIAVTTAGVAFVLLEGGLPSVTVGMGGLTRAQLLRGTLCGLASAAGLGVSYLFMKQGLRQSIDPLWASVIRTTLGCSFIWIGVGLRGQLLAIMRRSWSTPGVPRLLLYGCTVSTAGNCLALVGMSLTESGVMATLIGLQPIAIIPIIALADRKLPSPRAVIGSVIAFGGMVLLFLR
ncbi:hypothetical protein FACS1894168_3820 [Deltaproteobacteria bacterium]|nr:hypothetical protein FACS1894168_3820 [Deltaproteobacteria bacterium]